MSRTQRFVLIAVVSTGLFLAANYSRANQLLNGSFEDNTATFSLFNLTNAQFNFPIVANTTAFGSAQEIDLVTATDFGIAPQNGNWKLGLHTQASGLNDQFSSPLSSPLVAGATYSLQFFGAQLDTNPGGAIELGVSSSPTSFGTMVASGTPTSATVWTQFNSSFAAPAGASYLTVRTNSSTAEMYAFIDNISLNQVPEPSTVLLFLVGLAVWPRTRSAR